MRLLVLARIFFVLVLVLILGLGRGLLLRRLGRGHVVVGRLVVAQCGCEASVIRLAGSKALIGAVEQICRPVFAV